METWKRLGCAGVHSADAGAPRRGRREAPSAGGEGQVVRAAPEVDDVAREGRIYCVGTGGAGVPGAPCAGGRWCAWEG